MTDIAKLDNFKACLSGPLHTPPPESNGTSSGTLTASIPIAIPAEAEGAGRDEGDVPGQGA